MTVYHQKTIHKRHQAACQIISTQRTARLADRGLNLVPQRDSSVAPTTAGWNLTDQISTFGVVNSNNRRVHAFLGLHLHFHTEALSVIESFDFLADVRQFLFPKRFVHLFDLSTCSGRPVPLRPPPGAGGTESLPEPPTQDGLNGRRAVIVGSTITGYLHYVQANP